MEYIFGTQNSFEILRTKSPTTHSNLTSFHQIEHIYPDQTITDTFRIVRKLDSKEDSAGNCYDWYEIDHHYRTTDKTKPLTERCTAIEDAICDQDINIENRISALEDALCELDIGGI